MNDSVIWHESLPGSRFDFKFSSEVLLIYLSDGKMCLAVMAGSQKMDNRVY